MAWVKYKKSLKLPKQSTYSFRVPTSILDSFAAPLSLFLHRNNPHFVCLLTRYLCLYSCSYFLRVILACICRGVSGSFAAWSLKRPRCLSFLNFYSHFFSLCHCLWWFAQQARKQDITVWVCVLLTVAGHWLLKYSIVATAAFRGTFIFGNITTKFIHWVRASHTHWFDSSLHCLAS